MLRSAKALRARYKLPGLSTAKAKTMEVLSRPVGGVSSRPTTTKRVALYCKFCISSQNTYRLLQRAHSGVPRAEKGRSGAFNSYDDTEVLVAIQWTTPCSSISMLMPHWATDWA